MLINQKGKTQIFRFVIIICVRTKGLINSGRINRLMFEKQAFYGIESK